MFTCVPCVFQVQQSVSLSMPAIVMDALQRLRRAVDAASPTVASVAEPADDAAAAAAAGTAGTNLATDTMETGPSTLDKMNDMLLKELHKLPCE